jgi:uncharacterized protein
MFARRGLIIGLAALLFGAAQSVVTAAPPLRALIVDGQNYHNWQQTTPVLKKLLEETGLFSVDVATAPPHGQDMSRFQPDFARYNVTVLNYHGDDWPAATQRALERYMDQGGGLVIVHGASLNFPQWKAFNEMIGLGAWANRTEKHGPYVYWKDGQIVRDTTPGPCGFHAPERPFALVIRDKDHPITKGLPEKFMHAPDELYGKLRGPAKNMTVLATAYDNPAEGGDGRHEPVLMTINYGRGRTFHTTMGHNVPEMHSVAFIVTFQRGAEWAATGKVTQPLPADFPGPDQPKSRP